MDGQVLNNSENIELPYDVNLVLITSVIRPVNSESIYSENERFSQLLMSINSVRKKIPNSYIIVLEGSSYAEHMPYYILNFGANIFYFDVTHLDKQYGESNLINGFFSSDIFNKLKNKNILSITKLSGRYYLNNEFKFCFDNETCICSIVNPENSWSKYGIINTRYYSIPYKYCDNFINGIKRCCKEIFIDIEHSFYLYNIIPLNKINKNIIKLNVCGNLAPNGQFVED
jgi:hypothetical protein